MVVYVVAAHGRDICDPRTLTPLRDQLPPGVTVVERAMCGGTVRNDDAVELLDKMIDPRNLDTLQTANPLALRGLLGSVGIHRSDSANRLERTIVKSSLNFLIDFQAVGEIHPAGIIALPLRQPMPQPIIWSDRTRPLKRSDFMSLYANSVYPSSKDIDTILSSIGITDDISGTDYEKVDEYFSRESNFSDIVRKLPAGVYYHIACRAVSKGCLENAISSRQASGVGPGRGPDDVRDFNINDSVNAVLNGDLERAAKTVVLLPHQDFVMFFDILVKRAIELQPGKSRRGAICTDPVNILGLVILVMTYSSNPEQYRAEFHSAFNDCHPGSSNETIDSTFEKLKSVKTPRDVPPPAPDRTLYKPGTRVRLMDTDDPEKRAQRFYIVRRPNATDVNSKGQQFPPYAWMCMIEGSSKVVPIDEKNLISEPSAGGALWPPKYYRGLSTRRKAQRRREITRRSKMSWKDPKAYKPFATDKGTRRRPSSYSSRFHTKYPGVTGLPAIAKATGVSLGVLRKVYNRGMAAWRTGHRPGASPEAWGMARVHSFVLHGKTWRTADADLSHEK